MHHFEPDRVSVVFPLEPQVMPDQIFTVTELTQRIRAIIEGSFPVLWVQGEISGHKLHTSGHQYFTLKDENSQLSCVLWRGRSQNIPFQLRDGEKVLVQGQLTVYERGGRYQFDVFAVQKAGIGELALAFERLKKKLAAEGLFDADRKRPLPQYPERIGIVTSATGAAIRDIVTVCHRRWKGISLILRPALVQGEGSAQDIADGIQELNSYGELQPISEPRLHPRRLNWWSRTPMSWWNGLVKPRIVR
jgi:exodeoxyribonuclease VII large subunit